MQETRKFLMQTVTKRKFILTIRKIQLRDLGHITRKEGFENLPTIGHIESK